MILLPLIGYVFILTNFDWYTDPYNHSTHILNLIPCTAPYKPRLEFLAFHFWNREPILIHSHFTLFLRGKGTFDRSDAMGDNFGDFLFAFQCAECLQKRGSL